ncbi:MAG: TFIIB-type zinc ribbon-containing protein [Clostridia bacterium]|nr:TFIIB-type zinc ribbon-containing protein [Clostridia bacterium]
MGVFAAVCPCCGKDIGFDDKAAEYVCIYCGAKLRTSALNKVPVGKAAKEAEPGPKREGEEELTDEEVTKELIRKVEYKDDLRKVEKQIEELRTKRPKFESRLKTMKSLAWVGVGFAAAAAVVVVVFADENREGIDASLIVAAVLAAIGLFTIILAAIRRADLKKQQARLEESILEKKQKRDILIGRLNKINKRLHIHHGK